MKPRRKIPKAVKRIALVGGFLFLPLTIAILAIVIPDQFRAIPKPSFAIEILPEKTLEDKTSGQDPGAVDGLTSTTSLRRFHPVGDLSGLSETLRATAEEWNREVEKLIPRLNDLGKQATSLTSEEMEEELNALIDAYHALFKKYFKCFPKKPPPYDIFEVWKNHARSRHCWFAAINRIRLANALHHQEWKRVILTCQELEISEGGGPFYPDSSGGEWQWRRSEVWRDRQTYYLREWGLPGRAVLASRSLQKTLEPTLDKILGPMENYPRINQALAIIDEPTLQALEFVDQFLPGE